jgi:hypothetical protein
MSDLENEEKRFFDDDQDEEEEEMGEDIRHPSDSDDEEEEEDEDEEEARKVTIETSQFEILVNSRESNDQYVYEIQSHRLLKASLSMTKKRKIVILSKL